MNEKDRFQVVEDSQSGHCCFEFTVVDTHTPVVMHGKPYCPDGKPQYVALCECFERADADRIAIALSLFEGAA